MTWGASFLFIKIGLEGLSPTQVVLARLVFGAAALLAITLFTRQALPREAIVWGHLTVVAILLCVAPFLLFAWAEQHISSGLASIYNATTPLMTMLVALAALPAERPTPARLTGLVAGFGGVLVVLAPWRGLGDSGVLAQAYCLVATACYGLAFVYLRRFISPRGLSAVPLATVQVSIGAVLMMLAAPFIATQPMHLTARVTLSMLALGVLGTGMAYVWNTAVVAGWGATNASTVTYLTPLIGVALGVVLLDERVSWNQPVGAVIVVLGIVISQNRLLPTVRSRELV
ncbi:DMT family transporter [Micromonospora sp. NBC_00362]|nr:DMT family transporter [Micromonospora sp. NBC_00362]